MCSSVLVLFRLELAKLRALEILLLVLKRLACVSILLIVS
jgi:hypothetical protein